MEFTKVSTLIALLTLFMASCTEENITIDTLDTEINCTVDFQTNTKAASFQTLIDKDCVRNKIVNLG